MASPTEETAETYGSGLTWRSFLALIYCSIVLMPAALFSELVTGTGMGAAGYVAIFLAAEIVIKRLTGDNRDWETHNQNFINAIRKQFMNWRMLTPADKQKYYSSP